MIANILLLITACLPDDWTAASAAFKTSLEGTNEAAFERAVLAVSRDNSERAAKLLLSGLTTPPKTVFNETFYWLMITGLSRIEAKEAMAEVRRLVLSKETQPALRRDLMMVFQLSKSGAAEESLLKIAAGGSPDVQVTAIDDLVKRGAKAAIPVLIEIHRKEDKKESELLRQAHKALVNLTGTELATGDAWREWWDRNRDGFKVGEARKEAGAGDTVVVTIRRNRTTDYEELKKGRKDEIVVVRGTYDEVEKVLEKLAIPNTVIEKDSFDKQDLSHSLVLLINCDDYRKKRFTRAQLAKIRDFVAAGGYLFTSDWGLVDVLEDAFPGYVHKAGELPRMNVSILPSKGSTGHAFLRDVFLKTAVEGGGDKSSVMIEEKIDHRWEVDRRSFTIDFDPSRVTVLVDSPDLASETRNNAVAVTFLFGNGGKERPSISTGGVYEDLLNMRGGKVLHILSHFGKQQNKNDEFALQNMLLNFMIEAKERKLLRQAKK